MKFSGWVSKNQSSFTILDIQKLQRNYENSIALNEDIILKKVDEFIAKTEVIEKSIATVWVGLIAAILLIPIAYLMGKFNWNNVMHYLSHEFRVFYNLGEWNSNKIWEIMKLSAIFCLVIYFKDNRKIYFVSQSKRLIIFKVFIVLLLLKIRKSVKILLSRVSK